LAASVVSRGLRFSACAYTPYSWHKYINNFAKIVVVLIYLEQDDSEVEQDDSEVEEDDSEVEQDDSEGTRQQ
jgi:hypothetical protein